MHTFTRTIGRPWTTTELTVLRNEFIEGASIKEIAKKIGRNEDAVVYRLIRIGILGYPEDSSPENHGTIWSEREKNLLLKEYKDRKTIEEIARSHQRNRNSILCKLIECRAFDITNRLELEKYLHKDTADLVGNKDMDGNKTLGGDSKMGFERIPFNTTKKVPEKGVISGKKDAAFLRNSYQTELDNANAAVVNMVHYCEEQQVDLKEAYNRAQSWKATIAAHEKEREQAYANLGNLLNKETNFEKEMHKTTSEMYKQLSKNQKTETVKIKQRNIASDNEMTFGAMMKYIDKYPEYQSKSTFKKVLEKIDEKERELRHASEEYNKSVAKYHELLQSFKIYLQKARDKIDVYNKLLDEGQKKIDQTRFKKGIFYKFASERTKAEHNLDTMQHRVPQFENTLKIIEEELSQYEGRRFKELEY